MAELQAYRVRRVRVVNHKQTETWTDTITEEAVVMAETTADADDQARHMGKRDGWQEADRESTGRDYCEDEDETITYGEPMPNGEAPTPFPPCSHRNIRGDSLFVRSTFDSRFEVCRECGDARKVGDAA